MSIPKKGFWKNFSLKIFLLIAIYMFIATLAVGCIWNVIVKDPVSALLTSSALGHRAFDAIIAGFLISLLFVVMKRKNPD
jgi:uncharacterized BrkB/YihY/UPF0761 family membrane protein